MKENKGITLVALIITIIVMLILVGVTISAVVQSDIIGQGEQAGNAYKEKQAEEQNLNPTYDNKTVKDYLDEISQENDSQGSVTFSGYFTNYIEQNVKSTIYYVPDENSFVREEEELNWEEFLNPSNANKYGYDLANFTTKCIEKDACSYSMCYNLIGIVIPNTVTTIGSSAFNYCENLTNVIIPNSVTSIGSYAFQSTGITTIAIPNSVTSIENFTFRYCENLTNIKIPSSVTSISSSAFGSCSNLKTITVGSEQVKTLVENLNLGEVSIIIDESINN